MRKKAQRGCKALHSYTRYFPIGRPRAWLYKGLHYWLTSKPRNAHKAWEKSLAYAEELDMPYEQGLAYYEIGRHLSSDNPARCEHLNEALAIFERLNSDYEAMLIRESLELLTQPELSR